MGPPAGVTPFDKFRVPLLNTGVLVSSGVTVTWSHHAIQNSNFTETLQGLFITVLLGGYFTILQGMEYLEASFRIADRVMALHFLLQQGFMEFTLLLAQHFCVFVFSVFLKAI